MRLRGRSSMMRAWLGVEPEIERQLADARRLHVPQEGAERAALLPVAVCSCRSVVRSLKPIQGVGVVRNTGVMKPHFCR